MTTDSHHLPDFRLPDLPEAEGVRAGRRREVPSPPLAVTGPPRGGVKPPPVVSRPVARLAGAAGKPPSRLKRLARQQIVPARHRSLVSALLSSIVHAVLIIALGLWFSSSTTGPTWQASLVASRVEGEPELERASQMGLQASVSLAHGKALSQSLENALSPVEAPSAMEPTGLNPQTSAEHRHSAFISSDAAALARPISSEPAAAMSGRFSPHRGALLASGGGTPESEDAVRLGLEWLRVHQRSNGSWHFDHNRGPCEGRCGHPGTVGSTTGATAIAMLAYLGAGHTQREGDYQGEVRRALYYLNSRILPTPHGGDMQEGTMYAQALGALALCEAYAMTHDPSLEQPASDAIRFIVNAQDSQGGGWRYAPGQKGDTSVTGWQLMALRSGQMAYLPVPLVSMSRAMTFLDSVQEGDGAYYGYQRPDRNKSMTAVGLLSRMYNGWQREHRPLAEGVQFLARGGPSKHDLYYNYYATNVLHHWGGKEWERWNALMRDYLVHTQSRDGHSAGSWFFADQHGDAGGRHYNTCMAIMILEVYYRYLPLYSDRSVRDAF